MHFHKISAYFHSLCIRPKKMHFFVPISLLSCLRSKCFWIDCYSFSTNQTKFCIFLNCVPFSYTFCKTKHTYYFCSRFFFIISKDLIKSFVMTITHFELNQGKLGINFNFGPFSYIFYKIKHTQVFFANIFIIQSGDQLKSFGLTITHFKLN